MTPPHSPSVCASSMVMLGMSAAEVVTVTRVMSLAASAWREEATRCTDPVAEAAGGSDERQLASSASSNGRIENGRNRRMDVFCSLV